MKNNSVWFKNLLNKKTQLVDELSKLYPISDIQPVETKSWNGIFKATGDHHKYCLKFVNDFTTNIPRSNSDLMFICEFMSFLGNQNFGFFLPLIPSSNGKLLNQILEYRVFVSPWIDDFTKNSLNEDEAQSTEIVKLGARLLAKFHNCSTENKVINLTDRELPHCYNPFLWKRNLDIIFNKAYKNFHQRRSSQDNLAELNKIYNFCQNFIQNERDFFRNDLAKQIIIHGDFRPENIIGINSEYPKIFDFDVCHVNYPEVDVAYGALAFSGSRWFYGKRNWQLIDLFVKTYNLSSQTGMNMNYFEKALIWVMLKNLSVSFKEEQLAPRIELLYDIQKNLG